MDPEQRFLLVVLIIALFCLILELVGYLIQRYKNWKIKTGKAKPHEIGKEIAALSFGPLVRTGEIVSEKCPHCSRTVQFVWFYTAGIKKTALRCIECGSIFEAFCSPRKKEMNLYPRFCFRIPF